MELGGDEMLLPRYVKDVMKSGSFSGFFESEKIASSSEIHKFSSAFNAMRMRKKFAKDIGFFDAGDFAMLLAIDKVFHHLFNLYKEAFPSFLSTTHSLIDEKLKTQGFLLEDVLASFLNLFPPDAVYNGRISSHN